MITYGTDIAYGICAMWFYFGIVVTLVVECIVLAIASAVLKRKSERLEKSLKDAEEAKR